MLKFRMSQTKKFTEFEFWKFEFVSDFDIRISDLSIPNSYSAPAMPALAWSAINDAMEE